MAIRSFKKLKEKLQKSDTYWVERAKLHYSVALNKHFLKKGITQTELANSIGTSSAYITKVFRGDSNFTIETMVKLARAVGGELHIDIVTPKEKQDWGKIISQNQQIRPEYKQIRINERENKNNVKATVSATT